MKRRISVQVGDGLPKPPKPKVLRKIKVPRIKTGKPPKLPVVDIQISEMQIRAKTRKLKARWSPETIQDIAGFALVSPK